MKISDLKDSPDPKETEFYKKNGLTSLYIGIDRRYEDGELKVVRGFHQYQPSFRKPRDTFIILHNLANHLSQKKFGVQIRQGIFSTRSEHHADIFGNEVYRFIPDDGYDMFYNPKVKDFTVHSLNGHENSQKQRRVIERGVREIMRNAFFDHSFKSSDYIKHLLEGVDKINYDTFNVFEVSKAYFDKYFNEHKDKFKYLGDKVYQKKFYTELEKFWQEYYNDVKFYVDGLKKVTDIKEVGEDIEIITFPYNGFWLI